MISTEEITRFGKLKKILILFILSYIPLWIGISAIWQMFDSDFVDFREFLLIQLFVVLMFIVLYFIKNYRTSDHFSKNQSIGIGTIAKRKLQESMQKLFLIFQTENNQSEDVNEVNIVGYGQVKPCCYNGARLGDTYCMCGRTIPTSLINHINKQ